MQYLTYRKDIDGLRAFAVIIVLLFHLDISFFSGGFIGVDIFFVISGYLITSIILKDLKENKFNIFSFLMRRVKRLIPALLVVMIFSLLAGWFLLLPYDYKALGQQIVAQSFLLSNVLFYLQSGYFDAANDTKMLLHTWSLSLEWQFYIFIMIILFLAWRLFPKILFPIIILIFLSSFFVSIYGAYNHPSITFYMLPTRIWEFLMGALLVFVPQINIRKHISEIITILSIICLIMISIFYSSKIYFPGLSAFPVCFATALLILLGQRQTTSISKFLSNHILVFIGAISYSLYLWHWPLIVLAKYYNQGELSSSLIVTIIIASFILAWLSWKYIEKPFRKNSSLLSTYILSILTIIIILAGLSLHFNEGVENRFQGDTLSYIQGTKDRNPYQNQCDKPKLNDLATEKICQTNAIYSSDIDFILWGDSHADAIAPAFYALSKEFDVNGYILTYGGCPPILSAKQHKREKSFYCKKFNDMVLKLIEQKKIKNIFLAGSWLNWFNNENVYIPNSDFERKKAVAKAFHETIDILRNGKVNIYLLRSVPTVKFDPPRTLAHSEITNEKKPYIPLANYLDLRQTTDNLFKPYENIFDVEVIDPKKYLCRNEDQKCKVHHNGRSLYYNGGHLSATGAIYLSPLLRPYFEKLKSVN